MRSSIKKQLTTYNIVLSSNMLQIQRTLKHVVDDTNIDVHTIAIICMQ